MAPLTVGEHDEEEEEGRNLRTLLAFLAGMEGGGMPRDVFRLVMDLLMPKWDPLRRGVAGDRSAAVEIERRRDEVMNVDEIIS